MPPKTAGKEQGLLKPAKGKTLASYKNQAETPSPDVAAAPVTAPVAKKGKVGAPKKPKKEKLSAPLIIHLTEDEKKIIESKSGLVATGRYVRHILRTETEIFD